MDHIVELSIAAAEKGFFPYSGLPAMDVRSGQKEQSKQRSEEGMTAAASVQQQQRQQQLLQKSRQLNLQQLLPPQASPNSRTTQLSTQRSSSTAPAEPSIWQRHLGQPESSSIGVTNSTQRQSPSLHDSVPLERSHYHVPSRSAVAQARTSDAGLSSSQPSQLSHTVDTQRLRYSVDVLHRTCLSQAT